jgi:glycerol-3-phosphate acyltransferase PlsY
MSIELLSLFSLAGYLIGSFSFSRLFIRLFAPKCDISNLKAKAEGGEEMKMLTYGANAASLVLGSKLTMLISLFDILKIALPMLLLKLFFQEDFYYLIFSLAALVGNNWPIYYRFRGGTGFSVILGSVAVVDVTAAIATPFLGLFSGVFIFGNIGIANLGWLLLLVPWLWLRTFSLSIIIYAIVLNLIALIALIPEAKRFIEYSKKGKLKGLAETYYSSSPMARGIKKIFDWRNNLGKWKFLLALIATFILFFIFFLVYFLGQK